MSLRVENTAGVSIHASDPFPVNIGGPAGHRVVSASFESSFTVRFGGRRHGHVRLIADLDRELYQDATDIRRRAARAVIRIGLDTAKMIRDGSLHYVVARKSGFFENKPVPWFTVTLAHRVMFEGFERRAQAHVEIRSDDDEPQISNDFLGVIAGQFHDLAEGLHGAVDLSSNAAVFGPG
jgi:hypothetical protein